MPEQPKQPVPGEGTEDGRAVVTAKVYDAMWEAYRDGTRTIADLTLRFGVNRRTAARAVHQGWPDRGFASLKDRVVEYDRMRAEQERLAAQEKFKEATDAWYRAGKQMNRVADTAISFSIASLQQISSLALERTPDGRTQLRRLTKWVKRRRVEEIDGKRHVSYFDEEVPMTTAEAVKLQKSVLQAAGLASAFKRIWPTSTDEEKAQAGPPQGLAGWSDAQVEEFLKSGQLPAGLNAEDVFGVAVPGLPTKRKSN